jgi:hypothetical protein
MAVAGQAQALPHRDAIQRSFGNHDVSTTRAHVGGGAAVAADAFGADAFATGNDVAFREDQIERLMREHMAASRRAVASRKAWRHSESARSSATARPSAQTE